VERRKKWSSEVVASAESQLTCPLHACPTRSWHPRRVAARGFPRYSLGEDDVRLPAWHGMCSAGDHMKLESPVNRCRRLGYCGCDEPTLSELYSEADDRMFNGVVINPEHILHQFLTEREQTYNFRRRSHGSKTLLTKTQSLNEPDFFIKVMYKHSYCFFNNVTIVNFSSTGLIMFYSTEARVFSSCCQAA